MLRIAIGFLLSPLLGVLIATAIVLELHGRLDSWWWIYLYTGYFLAYPSALVLGIPAYLVVRRFTAVRWWHAAIGGALCAVPAWLMFGQAAYSDVREAAEAFNLMLMGVSGLISGVLFWLVISWPLRSNRSMQPTAASGR